MYRKNWQWMVLVAVALIGISFAGCKKGEQASNATNDTNAAAPAANEAAPAGTEAAPAEGEAAPAEGEAAAAGPVGDVADFDAICNKTVEIGKAEAGAAYTADMEKQALDACKMAGQAWSASPKAAEAGAAFAGKINEACRDKGGKDWLTCYGENAQAAGMAAAEAMMK